MNRNGTIHDSKMRSDKKWMKMAPNMTEWSCSSLLMCMCSRNVKSSEHKIKGKHSSKVKVTFSCKPKIEKFYAINLLRTLN